LAGADNDGTLRQIDVPILMYHYVSNPPDDADVYRLDLSVAPSHFRQQMQYLADHHYNVVSLYDVDLALRWGAPLPPRPVVLTFDDGYRDAFSEAFPVLEEFGYTATFFVITARLDQGHPENLTCRWQQSGPGGDEHRKPYKGASQPEARDGEFLYYQIQGSLESIERTWSPAAAVLLSGGALGRGRAGDAAEAGCIDGGDDRGRSGADNRRLPVDAAGPDQWCDGPVHVWRAAALGLGIAHLRPEARRSRVNTAGDIHCTLPVPLLMTVG
jgi:hypothetical protein